jgi:hypothetical protein
MSTPDKSEDLPDEPLRTSESDLKIPLDIPEVLTLSNGIRIRVKPFPRALLRTALSKFPDPEVPVVEFEDGSSEENPNDPDYLAAWETVHEERLEAAARVTLGNGIVPDLETLPDGIPGPEDDDWIKNVEALGGDVGDISTPFLRMYQWLNLIAIPNEDERTLVFLVAQQAAGLLEREVVTAMRYFQDLGARRARDYRANTENEEAGEGSGDRVREGDPVARVGVRREGRGEE